MKLGTEVGIDPGDIVLDGDPAPRSKKGHSPHFSTMSIAAKRLDVSRFHLVRTTEVGLGPGHIVLSRGSLLKQNYFKGF